MSAYRKMLRELGVEGSRWFRVAYRLAIREYPCLQCTFALATHAEVVAFGGGAPRLCQRCVSEYPDGTWAPVEKGAYCAAVRQVVDALGDAWLDARIP